MRAHQLSFGENNSTLQKMYDLVFDDDVRSALALLDDSNLDFEYTPQFKFIKLIETADKTEAQAIQDFAYARDIILTILMRLDVNNNIGRYPGRNQHVTSITSKLTGGLEADPYKKLFDAVNDSLKDDSCIGNIYAALARITRIHDHIIKLKRDFITAFLLDFHKTNDPAIQRSVSQPQTKRFRHLITASTFNPTVQQPTSAPAPQPLCYVEQGIMREIQIPQTRQLQRSTSVSVSQSACYNYALLNRVFRIRCPLNTAPQPTVVQPTAPQPTMEPAISDSAIQQLPPIFWPLFQVRQAPVRSQEFFQTPKALERADQSASEEVSNKRKR
jgi:hypothetical protein